MVPLVGAEATALLANIIRPILPMEPLMGQLLLSHLHGGSGGGAASGTGGGAGGGAISLEADGNGTLTIASGAVISANGGSVGNTATSGVVVDPVDPSDWLVKRLPTTEPFVQKVQHPQPVVPVAGGRIAFNYSTNLTEGNLDIGSGGQQGTVTFNTPLRG